jgi:hypothetical protein
MSTWEDVIETESRKFLWRKRLKMLQPLPQPFSIAQLAELWGISQNATRNKLTYWEKKHPSFLYRNTFQKNHLITFMWGTETTPEPELPTVTEVPVLVAQVERWTVEEASYPHYIKERTYTETIKKLEGMKPSILTPRSNVAFERLAWNEQKQRGRLKVIVSTRKNRLAMTCLYDNGFPVSALIRLE